jgi:hypothetical protein
MEGNMENEQRAVVPNGSRPWAAYNIIERKNGKSIWSRVGSAFKNRDGSFNLILDAFPIGGKLNLREDDREHTKERGALATEAEA